MTPSGKTADSAIGQDGTGAPDGAEQRHPLFRVVRGAPDDEELAALTLALLTQQPPPKAPGNPFAEVGRMLARRQRIGAGLQPGPGSWRVARPR